MNNHFIKWGVVGLNVILLAGCGHQQAASSEKSSQATTKTEKKATSTKKIKEAKIHSEKSESLASVKMSSTPSKTPKARSEASKKVAKPAETKKGDKPLTMAQITPDQWSVMAVAYDKHKTPTEAINDFSAKISDWKTDDYDKIIHDIPNGLYHKSNGVHIWCGAMGEGHYQVEVDPFDHKIVHEVYFFHGQRNFHNGYDGEMLLKYYQGHMEGINKLITGLKTNGPHVRKRQIELLNDMSGENGSSHQDEKRDSNSQNNVTTQDEEE